MAEELKNKASEAFKRSWEEGNVSLLDEIYAASYQAHSATGAVYNLDAEKGYILDTLKAFSNSKMNVTNSYEDGDTLIFRWVWTGKHTGESQFMAMPPTGKDCKLEGCTFLRTENGKIVEGWNYTHEVEFMKQLGMMPENPYAEEHTTAKAEK